MRRNGRRHHIGGQAQIGRFQLILLIFRLGLQRLHLPARAAPSIEHIRDAHRSIVEIVGAAVAALVLRGVGDHLPRAAAARRHLREETALLRQHILACRPQCRLGRRDVGMVLNGSVTKASICLLRNTFHHSPGRSRPRRKTWLAPPWTSAVAVGAGLPSGR